MAARVQHLLFFVSVVALLVMPCCNAARSLRTTTEFEPGTRSLLSSTRASEDDTEMPRNDTDLGVPTSARENESEFNQWARFQVQEVAIDYNPPEANPDPGNPSPVGD